MKKIVFLQKTNSYAGAENIVITIMKLLTNSGYECIYMSPDGKIREFVENEKLQFYPIKNASLMTIKNAINDVEPDIVHATDFGMSSYAGFLNLKMPVVAHLHNNVPWIKNPLHPKSIFFALALPKIKEVISVSPSIEEEYVYRKLLKGKNHVIYNVVDIERIRKLSSEQTNGNKKYDVGFLGRLTPQKKPLLFCEIIKDYKKQNKNIKAVIVGDGELKKDIEEYIWINNLEENIELLGFKNNPYKYIKNAKVLLMPSGYEGYGLAAVESLSLGLPVVCSGVGGLKNIVNDDCGKICHNKNEYINEMHELLNNNEYYLNKSKNAIDRSNKFGNLEEYKNKIIDVYKESLDLK